VRGGARLHGRLERDRRTGRRSHAAAVRAAARRGRLSPKAPLMSISLDTGSRSQRGNPSRPATGRTTLREHGPCARRCHLCPSRTSIRRLITRARIRQDDSIRPGLPISYHPVASTGRDARRAAMLSPGCGVPRPATSRLSTVDTLSINCHPTCATARRATPRGAPGEVPPTASTTGNTS
jgi:hypothetical protein